MDGIVYQRIVLEGLLNAEAFLSRCSERWTATAQNAEPEVRIVSQQRLNTLSPECVHPLTKEPMCPDESSKRDMVAPPVD
jgi:hypothetical protein